MAGLTGSLAFLVGASVKNRVVRQVKRLRQPRYLLATAIGVAYWWFYIGRQWFSGFSRNPEKVAEARPVFIAIGTLGLALIGFMGWFLGSDQSRLAFSEAEVQFLFPAPATRQQLLHYKLLRSILVSLLSAAIYTLFFRRTSGRPIFMTLGGWIAITTLSMHWTAASFVRKALAEHKVIGLRRTAARIAALGVFVGLVVVALQRTPHPSTFEPTLASAVAWANAATVPPLGWVLWPVRASVQLAFAGSLSQFAAGLPAALGVLLFHYVWVIRSAESFEDDALAMAERRARWREARKSGRSVFTVPETSRQAPFRLAGHGRPETALVWKDVIRMSRALRVRFFVMALPIVIALAVSAYFSARAGQPGAIRATVGILALTFYGLVVVMGPVLARSALANDPTQTEMLKASPISGTQVLAGETLGPTIVLAALQWLLLVPGVLLLPGDVGLVNLGERFAVIGALALLGPALSLGGVLVQNAAAVLVPGWVAAWRERGGGPEAMGMRMLVLLGNLLALSIAAIPAAILGGGAAFLLWGLLGWGALPIAAALATVAIAVEAGLTVFALGRAFDRYDLSTV